MTIGSRILELADRYNDEAMDAHMAGDMTTADRLSTVGHDLDHVAGVVLAVEAAARADGLR